MYRAASPLTVREPRANRDFLVALERMTPDERRRSSRRTFNARQRAIWAARYPEEVPLVNGEFEWIALLAADCD